MIILNTLKKLVAKHSANSIGFLIILLSLPAAAKPKLFMPSPVPVNVKPSQAEERLFGVGTNRITVVTPWNDNFFSSVSEDIGENKVTANHLAIGFVRSTSKRYTREWDFVAGNLDLESKTRRYRSSIIGKEVNVNASGKGFDIGLRYLGGLSLGQGYAAGGKTVDWNLALGIHAALYRLDNTYEADSVDGLDINHYNSVETGLFLRPSLALQPIIEIGGGISFVPYVGTNTMLIAGVESWEDLKFVRNGVAGRLSDDVEFFSQTPALEFIFGFDLGLISPFSREHKMTLGGAITELFGGSSGNFSEAHILYAVPLGKSQ